METLREKHSEVSPNYGSVFHCCCCRLHINTNTLTGRGCNVQRLTSITNRNDDYGWAEVKADDDDESPPPPPSESPAVSDQSWPGRNTKELSTEHSLTHTQQLGTPRLKRKKNEKGGSRTAELLSLSRIHFQSVSLSVTITVITSTTDAAETSESSRSRRRDKS